jgi:hypothetical protein
MNDEALSRDPRTAALRVKGPERFAMAMLLANALFYAIALLVNLADLARVSGNGGVPSVSAAREMNEMHEGIQRTSVVLIIVGGVSFFLWVSRAFRAARELNARPIRFKAVTVNLGFFIPILNFVRPYQGLRALDDAINPAKLREPPPHPETGAHAGGYREAALADRGAPFDMRRPPLLLWWAFWLVSNFLGLLSVAASRSWEMSLTFDAIDAAAQAVCATLAILVVRRITQRLMERARRLAAVTTDSRR